MDYKRQPQKKGFGLKLRLRVGMTKTGELGSTNGGHTSPRAFLEH